MISIKKLLLSIFIICSCVSFLSAQPVFSKFTTKENRTKFNAQLLKTITEGLSVTLTDSTEESWEDAFNAAELIGYHDETLIQRTKTAFIDIDKRSTGFQRSLLEMLYTLQIKDFKKDALALLKKSSDAKIIAMCAEYLVMVDPSKENEDNITELCYAKAEKLQNEAGSSAIMYELLRHLFSFFEKKNIPDEYPAVLFDKNYLKGSTVIYSIQRKNRNYPGIVIIKDTAGNFYKDENGSFFSVTQLARSESNLPGYLTNGNTPQGLFRMYGFDISKSSFIGPTTNIQLTMPLETSVQHFLKDSSIKDTVWSPELYQQLLPEQLKDFNPLMESFYASLAGRTEIIAHGTTVDPEFYKGQSYYPLTPTAGCLCSKEIWFANGTRAISDQQLLVDAVKKAGGANGYVIVLELNDEQKPVSLNDVLIYLK
ncbi:MAG: hypothetical protein ABJA78_09610 [Ferruginibacter sp.]